MPEPLILDDVEAALDRLTCFGKAVVGPVAKGVRESILLHAAVRGWPVIQHSAFTNWAEAQIDPDLLWLVLDPLVSLQGGARTEAVRFTRIATADSWKFDAAFPPNVEPLIQGSLVGILDDAVHSGATLRHAAALIVQAGGEVDDVIVASSTAVARASLSDISPGASWAQFCKGSYSATHLRDGCPCLPFAGRRAFDKMPVMTESGPIEVRVPITAFRGGLWQQLIADRTIRHAVVSARRTLAQRFSAALGRPATVGDIPLLGPSVSVPLLPGQSATADTKLETILM